jgi:hypothetical protein
MSTVIVTAADEGYAPLLGDLLDSLEGHRCTLTRSKDIAARSALALRSWIWD